MLSVTEFGAKELTDCTKAFKEAATQAKATKQALHVPEGVWYLADTLHIPYLGLTIRGDGMDRTIIKAKPGSQAFNMLVAGYGTPTVITDLTLDGNKEQTRHTGNLNIGSGLFVTNGEAAHQWLNVAFRNHHSYGVRAQRGDGGSWLTVTARDCEGTRNGYDGIAVNGASGATISGRYNNNGQYGILITRTTDATLDATANNNDSSGIVATYSHRFTITGATTGNGKDGVAVGGGSPNDIANTDWTVNAVVATGNQGHGITVDPTVDAGRAEQQRGTVTGCTTSGNMQHGLYLQHAIDLTATGNISTGNGMQGCQIAHVVGAIVTGNLFAHNTGYGLAVSNGNNPALDGSDIHATPNLYLGNIEGATIVDPLYPRVTI